MSCNEYDPNRYLALSVRQQPRPPIVRRKREPIKLTPAGMFWLHYILLFATAFAALVYFWV